MKGVRGPAGVHTHGTVSCYQRGCRCPKCSEVGKAARAERRRRQGAKPRQGFTHGTIYGYRWKECRCPECTAANTAYHRRLREKVA